MHIPNGSSIFVESQRLATKFEITGVSATSDGGSAILRMKSVSGLASGDVIVVTNATATALIGATGVIADVQSTPVAQVTIKGLNTQNANRFPSGTTGEAYKVTAWTEIPCVQDMSQEGGEQQYYTYQCLSDEQEQREPTYKSAVSVTYTFAHEYNNAIYPLLRKYDESGQITAFRMYIPRAKENRNWSGVVSFNDVPQTTVNEMETVSINVSLKGKFVSSDG